MKAIYFLLAAGIFLLPAYGESAEKKDIHAVMTATESEDTASDASADTAKAPEKGESALDEEMDDLGDESLDERDANGKVVPMPYEGGDEKAADAQEKSAAEGMGHGYGTDQPLSAHVDASYDAGAYGDLTAIGPVTLAGGDWIFIEGDERRGWFFDRSMMAKNTDGTISYWQLILYNDFGRAQFVEAMHDAEYDKLAYTLQRRVLDLKKNTIRTYEIIAYDGENTVITDGDRDGHAAEIRPNTMAEKERDAVKKAAKKLKYKK
jgi:hypothetical protein